MNKIETFKHDVIEGKLFVAREKRRKKAKAKRQKLRKKKKKLRRKARIKRKKDFDMRLGELARKYYFSKFDIVQNRIFFVTFNGIYNCNPKYITEELIRQGVPVEIYWGVTKQQLQDSKKDKIPPQIHLVEKYTFDYYKAQATSKIWVDNAICCVWKYMPKKEQQFYIDTWHGSMGLKSVSKQDITDMDWLKKAMLCGEHVDCCISNSTFETQVFRETYFANNKIYEFGHARNDILFSNKEKMLAIKEKVLKRYRLAKYDEEGNLQTELNEIKICLYAPTFRDDKSIDFLDIDFDRLRFNLSAKWGGEWVVFNRLHFHDRKQTVKKQNGVINVTSYPDIQELMLCADVGVTDYSSWICDFVLTGRPGFIYASDLDRYDSVRGLYYPLSETPFPIAKNNDELMQNIQTFCPEAYEKKRREFLLKRGCCENGNAAAKAVGLIKEIMEIK
ncbi:MAG: CDP-glycerol glycerophosphotransferase family protein [Clostridiales bacterium]|nr:CDP-glycerol glycerophosphotransferase family protein [Clostridiales bacterium]